MKKSLSEMLSASARALSLVFVVTFTAFAEKDAPASSKGASVDMVFVLDTTGSMGGLIEGAKQKIWSIVNEVAAGKPSPMIRIGLVAYRDKGDQYVTRTFDLSENLDSVYEKLLSFTADGGGDGPEHVLMALEDSIERMAWSKTVGTFKVVYLVGDSPAHKEYGDTPALEKLAQAAVRRGVVINTVQCGRQSDTEAEWRRLARLSEGRYLPIPQDGGMVTVATPYDGRIAELNSRVESTMLAYGSRRREASAMFAQAKSVSAMASAPAAAERAIFTAGLASAGRGASADMDLVRGTEEGKVDVAKLEKEQLPDELRNLSPEQRRQRVEQFAKEREACRGQISELSLKRSRWLKEHQGKGRKDSFDSMLMESLKAQAAAKGIAY